MRDFKKGDKVKCVKLNPCYDIKLEVGKIYTIDNLTDNTLFIKNFIDPFTNIRQTSSIWFYRNDFELAKGKENKFTEMVCSMREFANDYPEDFKVIMEQFK